MSAKIVKLRDGSKTTAKCAAALRRQEKREKEAIIDARIAAALKGKDENDTIKWTPPPASSLMNDIEGAVVRGMMTFFAEVFSKLGGRA